jgi:hypothetical protein
VTTRVASLAGVILALLQNAVIAQIEPAPARYTPCGSDRWSVKTGSDEGALYVDPQQIPSAAIADMRLWTRPSALPIDERLSPYETTMWQATGTITYLSRERDSDVELVLADAFGNTVIVELPDPGCVPSSSPFLPQITAARATYDARAAAGPPLFVHVLVQGLGFFDSFHSQVGYAPNGFELHPVTYLQFLDDRTPPPTAIVPPFNPPTVRQHFEIGAGATPRDGLFVAPVISRGAFALTPTPTSTTRPTSTPTPTSPPATPTSTPTLTSPNTPTPTVFIPLPTPTSFCTPEPGACCCPCKDGWISPSCGKSGACSHHGGEVGGCL